MVKTGQANTHQMKALTFSNFGSTDVLEYINVPDPALKNNEVLIQAKAIGLNYADIYRRKGIYHLQGKAPYIAGYEAAGIVVDANNCAGFKAGDRVAFADVPFANAELIAAPADRVISLPDEISFETAASVMLQGLTAQYLTSDSHLVKPGELVLVHSAAGGVGQILIQMCKAKGATVIGLTSSEPKKAIALTTGAHEVLLYDDNWVEKILQHYPNGVDVVYDAVGSTLSGSIQITKKCGHIIFYGTAGGNPVLIDPVMLMDTSKTITGGDLWNYLTSNKERNKRSKQLFEQIICGQIIIQPATRFKLAEGKAAHHYLESRQSSGKIIMIP
jgi:NADPH2:quinone reductase